MTGGTGLGDCDTIQGEGGSLSGSLRDAVTVTRVLMANGLLTEAFYFARRYFEELGREKKKRYRTEEEHRRVGEMTFNREGAHASAFGFSQHAGSDQSKGFFSSPQQQNQQHQVLGFSSSAINQHVQEGCGVSRVSRGARGLKQLDGGFRVSPNAADVWGSGRGRGVAVCVLVSEIFWAALRNNSADRLLGLSWNEEEAAVLHCCLLARAQQQPRGGAGSLLVLLYLEVRNALIFQ